MVMDDLEGGGQGFLSGGSLFLIFYAMKIQKAGPPVICRVGTPCKKSSRFHLPSQVAICRMIETVYLIIAIGKWDEWKKFSVYMTC